MITFSLTFALLSLFAAAEPAATADGTLPKELAPFFNPPAEYAKDLGSYRSPLKFSDGALVKTAADWRKRRQEILTTWEELLGAWPPVIDKPKVEYRDKEQREGLTQHRLRLEIAPGVVTDDAYLLVPAGEGPFPAVVVVFYDAATGIGRGKPDVRADFGYQLAKRGFVALSLGGPAAMAATDKKPAPLQPLSYNAYVAANCYQALAQMPQVDAQRVGVVGLSYGGKWAMFASCLYEKFACAAWSDPGIVFDEKRANINYWEPWYLGLEPGQKRKAGVVTKDNPRTGAYKKLVESGHDLHELHALMAPRPFLVSGGSEDPPERWRALNHTIAVNELLGYKNRVAMTNRPGHIPTAEANEQLCRFFEHFLKNGKAAAEPFPFTIKTETVLEHDDGKFLWFHPRVAAIPKAGRDGKPAVLMTLQKHLSASDHYSGLYFMRSDDLGATWTKPVLPPALDWRKESDKVDVAVADVTPGWHSATNKVLAIGAEVRYSKKGEQLDDQPRSHQTAYAVYDPKTGQWTGWKRLEMPKDDKWNFARSACAQWLVQADGTLLLPFYFGRHAASRAAHVTVVQCSFDGREVKYLRHGTELTLEVERGLVEPSLAAFKNKYFLTLRNDQKGYVTTSDDGLTFRPIKPWTFDDGKELGSYNTQQHWLVHGDGLFLAYTRRGANNDHIFRHRAPLFLAQVDPEKLQVLRATERVLMPERGATLGNFGAAAVTEQESWVTDSEGIWDEAARKRGAKGATFLARVRWSSPNRLAPEGK